MSEVHDVDDRIEDDERADDEELDEAEPTEAELASATTDLPPDPATGGDVESIQELLVKQEAREEEHEDEEVPVALDKDEPAETVLDSSRVVPMQSTEFQCRRCYLVKNRSQLADKNKLLCRDCA